MNVDDGIRGRMAHASAIFAKGHVVAPAQIIYLKVLGNSVPVNLNCRQILPGRCPVFEPRGWSLLRDRHLLGFSPDFCFVHATQANQIPTTLHAPPSFAKTRSYPRADFGFR